MKTNINERLYSLEILRFLAAFIVFFGHYVHFYMHNKIQESNNIFFELNPSFIGGLAVPLFFMMSGVIFVHVYKEEILTKRISFKSFAYRRFARLYPLHILTLLLCAFLQNLIFIKTDNYFIYQFNDLKHFFLQLFFISDIGFEKGHSFNGPIWSVSNEVVLYICFFILCFISRHYRASLIFSSFVILSYVLVRHFNLILLKSAFSFFVGALICIYLQKIFYSRMQARHYFLKLIIYFGSLVLMHKIFSKGGLPHGSVAPILVSLCILFDRAVRDFFGETYKKVAIFLGAISYSAYLIHFPLQLFLILMSSYFLDLDFTKPYMLFIYVSLVLVSSIISFFLFEKPMQKYLLSKLI